MGRTIQIGKPYLQKGGDFTFRLCADLYQDQKLIYTMWFEVSEKYAKYLCNERSDAFVVELLLYAMEHEFDIVCKQEMSERLYYQLNECLIPAISANIPRYKRISLQAPVNANQLPCAGGVGTALSGGVDSFYTVLQNLNRETPYNITHFTFFNEGSCGDFGGESARAKFHERIDWIKDTALQLNREMVLVDSNANEFLKQRHVSTQTFRTLANVLALQKLFSTYLLASTVPFHSFSFQEERSWCYELLTVHCLSTETTSFYVSGGDVTRLEKVSAIAEYPVTYDRLNVCGVDATNCSKCEKCKRTMMELYCANKLDLYDKVFDLNYFHDKKDEYITYAFIHRKEEFWDEIYRILHERGEVTFAIKLKSLLYGRLRSLWKSIPFAHNIYLKFKRV